MAGDMRIPGLALLLAMAAPAWADNLPDPTRPPAGYGADPATGEVVDNVPRLQSVLIPAKGRPTAVIGGQTVRLGEKVGDGRLTRLTEDEAVIVGPQGVQRLRLTPDVEKVNVRDKITRKSVGNKKESP